MGPSTLPSPLCFYVSSLPPPPGAFFPTIYMCVLLSFYSEQNGGHTAPLRVAHLHYFIHRMMCQRFSSHTHSLSLSIFYPHRGILMERLVALIEQHCYGVSQTAAAAETIVDRLRNEVGTVVHRSQRTKRDAEPWEKALKNVLDAQEELERATASYTIPRYIHPVIRGEASDVETLVKALQHLTQSLEFLDQQPPNDVGTALHEKVRSLLDQACEATQKAMYEAVVGCIRPAVATPAPQQRQDPFCDAPARVRSAKYQTRLFRDDWQTRTADVFRAIEQLGIVYGNLKAPLEITKTCCERVQAYATELLSDDYTATYEARVDDVGGTAGVTAVMAGRRRPNAARRVKGLLQRVMQHTSDDLMLFARGEDLAAAASTYVLGDHPLITYSRDVRQLISECLMVYDAVVLQAFPTSEEDPRYHEQIEIDGSTEHREEAHGIPSEWLFAPLATSFFDRVMAAIAHVSRSPSVTVFDCSLIALDLLSESWQWRRAARGCPGGRFAEGCETYDAVKAMTDDRVDTILQAAGVLLEDYHSAKGQLDLTDLIVSTASEGFFAVRDHEFGPAFAVLIGVHTREFEEEEQGPDQAAAGGGSAIQALPRSVRCRWLPSLDCGVHGSTSGMLRYFKLLLSGFEGSFRVAMCGSCEVADRMIGKVASSTDTPSELAEYVQHCMVEHISDVLVIAKATSATLNSSKQSDDKKDAGNEAVEDPSASLFGPFNAEVFLANNFSFVMQALQNDPAFCSASKKYTRTFEEVAEQYEAAFNEAVDNYGALWSRLCPPVDSSSDLVAAAASDAPRLTRSQRVAVKQWYTTAKKNVVRMLKIARSLVVSQRTAREKLSEAAANGVEAGYEQFEELVVKQREWTTHTAKYFVLDDSEAAAAEDSSPHAQYSAATVIGSVREVFPTASTSSPRSKPRAVVEL